MAPISIIETDVAKTTDSPFKIPIDMISGQIKKPTISESKKNGDKSFAAWITNINDINKDVISIVITFSTKLFYMVGVVT